MEKEAKIVTWVQWGFPPTWPVNCDLATARVVINTRGYFD